MDARLQLRLFFHGGVILLAALVAGIPFGTTITGRGDAAAHAWHVAHTGGIDTALLILALGLVVPTLALGRGAVRTFEWATILSGYPFMVGAIVSGLTGVRGLAPVGPPENLVVWAGFTLSGVASLVAGGLLVWGALAALRGRG